MLMCRWCITGTPLSRGLEDLYGLFFFLHANPYSERHFWRSVLQVPYMEGCPAGANQLTSPAVYVCMCLRIQAALSQHLILLCNLPPRGCEHGF